MQALTATAPRPRHRRQATITQRFKGQRSQLILAQAARVDLSAGGIAAGTATGSLLRTVIPYESVKDAPPGVKTFSFDVEATGLAVRRRCDAAYGGYFHRPTEMMFVEMADGGGPGGVGRGGGRWLGWGHPSAGGTHMPPHATNHPRAAMPPGLPPPQAL